LSGSAFGQKYQRYQLRALRPGALPLNEGPGKASGAENRRAAGEQMSDGGPQSQTIVVVGGGIAGVTAALEVAETGYEVVLLEKGPSLGGRVSRLNRYFPKLCHPTCGLEINYQRIKKTPRLSVVTMAEVLQVSGTRGGYTLSVRKIPRHVNAKCTACGACAEAAESTVANPFNYGLDQVKAAYLPHEHAYPMRYVVAPEVIGSEEATKIRDACPYGAIELDETEETFELAAGAIIWATGWRPYDAAKIDTYGYSASPDIINNVEMERLASHDGPTGGRIERPSNGEPAKSVALIQCAGSRDVNHLPYCSMICCLASLKHAAYLREQYADAQVDIYYIDIRAHDKMSSFYERVRHDPGVNFIKSKPGHIELGPDGRPVVCGEHTIERGIYRNPYDLVVLATGMEPSLGFGLTPHDDVERDEYGFVMPAVSGDGGQFSAGVASGPIDVALSTQSATAAALKAIQAVRAG
jgi:quinone-modifying oxidoreductase subunit QmoA